jgi:hypothetical protein
MPCWPIVTTVSPRIGFPGTTAGVACRMCLRVAGGLVAGRGVETTTWTVTVPVRPPPLAVTMLAAATVVGTTRWNWSAPGVPPVHVTDSGGTGVPAGALTPVISTVTGEPVGVTYSPGRNCVAPVTTSVAAGGAAVRVPHRRNCSVERSVGAAAPVSLTSPRKAATPTAADLSASASRLSADGSPAAVRSGDCCAACASSWASTTSPSREPGRYSPAPKAMLRPKVTARAWWEAASAPACASVWIVTSAKSDP